MRWLKRKRTEAAYLTGLRQRGSRFGVREALAMLFPPDIYLDLYLPYDTRREEHSPMQNCLLSLLYSRKLGFAGSSS
jgi:hypothetical protein